MSPKGVQIQLRETKDSEGNEYRIQNMHDQQYLTMSSVSVTNPWTNDTKLEYYVHWQPREGEATPFKLWDFPLPQWRCRLQCGSKVLCEARCSYYGESHKTALYEAKVIKVGRGKRDGYIMVDVAGRTNRWFARGSRWLRRYRVNHSHWLQAPFEEPCWVESFESTVIPESKESDCIRIVCCSEDKYARNIKSRRKYNKHMKGDRMKTEYGKPNGKRTKHGKIRKKRRNGKAMKFGMDLTRDFTVY